MPRPYVYGQPYCITLTALLKPFISDVDVEHLSGCPRNYRTIAKQVVDDDLAVSLEVACATLEVGAMASGTAPQKDRGQR